jgi:hypothetical protein
LERLDGTFIIEVVLDALELFISLRLHAGAPPAVFDLPCLAVSTRQWPSA